MAERRMFHTSVVESDQFLDLPIGSQAIYFHLGMHADDDGFVNGPRQIVRKIRRPMKELQLLVDAGFVFDFDGILVLRHWRVANSLRSDRLKVLNYPEIAARLHVLHNREYSLEPKGFSKRLLDIRPGYLPDSCATDGIPNIMEDNLI